MRRNNIIEFRSRQKLKSGQKYSPAYYGDSNLSIDFLNSYIDVQIKFNKDYENLINNFKTRSNKFMFPTTLSGYRKNINPVKALYNCLQEALFNFNSENKIYTWTVNLFKNKKWLEFLILSIRSDIERITQFINKYSHFTSTYVSSKILELMHVRKDFIHYIEAFSIMDTWDNF